MEYFSIAQIIVYVITATVGAVIGFITATLKVAKYFNQLNTSMQLQQQYINERTKDINRLEGAIEHARKDIIDLTAQLRDALQNLNALWITLQNLYPDKVPARLSDKK